MGTTDRTKKLVSMAAELLLIIASYYVCGVIRVFLPQGKRYAFADTLTYGYLAVLYAVVFVGTNSKRWSVAAMPPVFDTLK